jgi:hypothetical protein
MAGTIPIITLEVDRMKHQIKVALLEYEGMLSQEIQDAVDAYCTPENVRNVVADAVKHTVDDSLKEELHHYFRYGAGHHALLSVIRESLDHHIKDEFTTGDIRTLGTLQNDSRMHRLMRFLHLGV